MCWSRIICTHQAKLSHTKQKNQGKGIHQLLQSITQLLLVLPAWPIALVATTSSVSPAVQSSHA